MMMMMNMMIPSGTETACSLASPNTFPSVNESCHQWTYGPFPNNQTAGIHALLKTKVIWRPVLLDKSILQGLRLPSNRKKRSLPVFRVQIKFRKTVHQNVFPSELFFHFCRRFWKGKWEIMCQFGRGHCHMNRSEILFNLIAPSDCNPCFHQKNVEKNCATHRRVTWFPTWWIGFDLYFNQSHTGLKKSSITSWHGEYLPDLPLLHAIRASLKVFSVGDPGFPTRNCILLVRIWGILGVDSG